MTCAPVSRIVLMATTLMLATSLKAQRWYFAGNNPLGSEAYYLDLDAITSDEGVEEVWIKVLPLLSHPKPSANAFHNSVPDEELSSHGYTLLEEEFDVAGKKFRALRRLSYGPADQLASCENLDSGTWNTVAATSREALIYQMLHTR